MRQRTASNYRGSGAGRSAGAPGRRARLAALAPLLLSLAACSVGIPIGSLVDEELTTGSVPPPSPITPRIDGVDWALAEPALQAALNDTAAAPPRRWTGARASGSFAAVGGLVERRGDAHRKVERCRSFVAGVEPALAGGRPIASEWVQGVACQLDTGEWSVREAGPWQKPG